MKIFVIINDDGDPEGAFRIKNEAITYCQKVVESLDIDMDEWDCYYRIYEVELDG